MPIDADLLLVDYSLGGCGQLRCSGIATHLVGGADSAASAQVNVTVTMLCYSK
jgi:hypothetical protein